MMPTQPERLPISTQAGPPRMTSRLQVVRRVLLAGAVGVAGAWLSGCGNEADLEAPAPAPAPGSSKVMASQGTAGDAVLDPAPGSGPAADATAQSATVQTSAVLAQVNLARSEARQCGSSAYPAALPLSANADTEAAADSHTRWMQANRIMSHDGDAGSSVGSRLADAGYRWSAVGENVAAGHPTPAAMVAAWLGSPGHCANIMNAGFVDVGFAFAPAAAGAATYGTMVLARPR